MRFGAGGGRSRTRSFDLLIRVSSNSYRNVLQKLENAQSLADNLDLVEHHFFDCMLGII